MRRFFILMLSAVLLLCGCSGESREIEDITEIKLYTFEWTLPESNEEHREPVVITDAETIAELVRLGGDKELYEPWDGEYYEGINSYWIDYGNGLIVGMYDDIDYGNFCDFAGELYDEPYYKMPDGLREKIIELTEQ